MTAVKQPKSFKEDLPRRTQAEQAKPSVRKGSHQAIVMRAIRDTLSRDKETLRELSKV